MCTEQNIERRLWNSPIMKLYISVQDVDNEDVLPATQRVSTHWAIQTTLTVGHLTVLRERKDVSNHSFSSGDTKHQCPPLGW